MRAMSASPRPTTRSIVLYPDPVLLAKASPVAAITDEIRSLVDDMIRIMRDEDGAGIAAPQVGESLRIFVVEAREATETTPEEPLGVYINPVLKEPAGAVEPFEEGCLSLPGIRADIRRPPTITIEATDLDGRRFTRTDGGILARIWQHEYDHLEGTLILDRMTPIDRLASRRKVKALREEYEDEQKSTTPRQPPHRTGGGR
jgi:peptide deformylase